MPTTTRSFEPGPANEKLGGIPVVHYLDFASKGRGQVIRLLFEDAGVAYDDVRYKLPDEYTQFKETKLSEMNPLATVPVVELNGKILTQSYAIVRHFARVLGKYDGQTEQEKFWADRICDIVVDWRTQFVTAFLSATKDVDYPKHVEGPRKNFLKGVDTLLQYPESNSGPYIIGKEVTYADLALYQILHDESLTKDGQKGLREGGYDRLAELAAAMEARPNVSAFLKSSRYLG